MKVNEILLLEMSTTVDSGVYDVAKENNGKV